MTPFDSREWKNGILHTKTCLWLSAILFLFLFAPGSAAAQKNGYPITPVLFTDVQVEDAFWSKRLETNRTVSIPHALAQCEITGRIRNFEIADSVLRGMIPEGKFCSRYGFDDSDVYKTMEGIAYALHTRYDAGMDARMDSLIEKVARAQEKDGYLYTMRTIKPDASWAKERWVNDRTKGSHELYNVGHLYEAAVAHYYATGKRTLLNIALKSADLLVATFGPDKMHTVPGHQVTEMGLCKLYQVTGKKAYVDLADFFVHERGRGTPQGESYNQDHIPVEEQTEAVGHAVRAGYLYAGMADVAALRGDPHYVPRLDRIWEDLVFHKLYITGGGGAVGKIEGYGPPYVLPNLSAYCETCASIALAYWNYRMFLHHGDAKYMDVFERALYNGFLSGVSMTGDRFFYPNPLESINGAERSPWFTCACCPPNDIRFIASLPGYVYATGGEDIYVNLYIGGTGTIRLGNRTVTIQQQTKYPWDGTVSITMGMKEPATFTLRLRIPGWAAGKPLPGDLYTYREGVNEQVRLSVNGVSHTVQVANGYAFIKRQWSTTDRVELVLPMPVHRVAAHEKILDDKGKVAFERGPIVFCLESPDQPEPWLLDLVIPDSASLTTRFNPNLLGGVQTVSGFGTSTNRTLDGLTSPGPRKAFVAVPYYAWAHRGQHQMTVWPAREAEASKPKPEPTLAFLSNLTTSGGRGEEALKDQLVPESSNDPCTPHFHWWPKKGTPEWVQYHFPQKSRVSEVMAYWFDDDGDGECRLPKSWEILYHDGTTWQAVRKPSSMVPRKDAANRVTFETIETTDLRLSIKLPEGFSSGLYEWTVR